MQCVAQVDSIFSNFIIFIMTDDITKLDLFEFLEISESATDAEVSSRLLFKLNLFIMG